MDASKKDILFSVVAGSAALAAILAMPALVASPKLLFGRSLSAIAPSLFPYVTLILIVLLCAGLCIVSLVKARLKQTRTVTQTSVSNESGFSNNAEPSDESAISDVNQESTWLKKAAFFLLLVGERAPVQ